MIRAERDYMSDEFINRSFKRQYANGRFVNYHIMTNNAVLPDDSNMVIHNVTKKLPRSMLPQLQERIIRHPPKFDP